MSLPPPSSSPVSSPPGWYPDPWGQAAWRWFDGVAWTGLASGPAPTATTRLPLLAGLGGLGVLLLSIVVAAVMAGFASLAGASDAFVTILIGLGGYLPVVAWAVFASRRWGTGHLSDDVGYRFRPIDALLGPVVLIACYAAEVAVILVVSALGLEPGTNTGGLGDEYSWASRVALVVVAVVLAPLVEELLFRGLLLRSLQGRMPVVGAVAVQAVLFGLVHYTPDQGWGNVGLVGTLTAVGAVLGASAVITRRLGPGIVAHALLNSVALAVVFSGVTT